MEWQPIATAPHGDRILLCEVDKWVPPEMHVGWWSGTGWVREGDDCDIVVVPTHWMPLPEPPADTPTI